MEKVELARYRNRSVMDIVRWLDVTVSPNANTDLKSFSHSGAGRYVEWQAADGSWRLIAHDIPVSITAYFSDAEMATLFRLTWI